MKKKQIMSRIIIGGLAIFGFVALFLIHPELFGIVLMICALGWAIENY